MRGMNEPLFTAINASPVMTDAELLKAAKLTDRVPSEVDPFRIDFVRGATNERDNLTLDAQESHLLRESEARDFYNMFRRFGAVLVPAAADDVERLQLVHRGLVESANYFASRGAVRLTEYRSKHGLDAEGMELRRYTELWPYHYNQAKADAYRKEAEAVQVQLREAEEEAATRPDAEQE